MKTYFGTFTVVLLFCSFSLSAAGLLGAGAGEGSCAAPPFRSHEVQWSYGCPSFAPCCSEFGFCRPLAEWEYGEFRDCNGVSNGTPLPPEVIAAEEAAGGYAGTPAGEVGPPPDVIKAHHAAHGDGVDHLPPPDQPPYQNPAPHHAVHGSVGPHHAVPIPVPVPSHHGAHAIAAPLHKPLAPAHLAPAAQHHAVHIAPAPHHSIHVADTHHHAVHTGAPHLAPPVPVVHHTASHHPASHPAALSLAPTPISAHALTPTPISAHTLSSPHTLAPIHIHPPASAISSAHVPKILHNTAAPHHGIHGLTDSHVLASAPHQAIHAVHAPQVLGAPPSVLRPLHAPAVHPHTAAVHQKHHAAHAIGAQPAALNTISHSTHNIAPPAHPVPVVHHASPLHAAHASINALQPLPVVASEHAQHQAHGNIFLSHHTPTKTHAHSPGIISHPTLVHSSSHAKHLVPNAVTPVKSTITKVPTDKPSQIPVPLEPEANVHHSSHSLSSLNPQVEVFHGDISPESQQPAQLRVEPVLVSDSPSSNVQSGNTRPY